MDAYKLNNLIKFLEDGEEDFDLKVYLYLKVIDFSKYDNCLLKLAENIYNCICNDTI